MKPDQETWNSIAVLSSEIRDLEKLGHSEEFIELVMPNLVNAVKEHLTRVELIYFPHKIDEPKEEKKATGRPPMITGALKVYVLKKYNEDKLSSRKIQTELATFGIYVHHNTIMDCVHAHALRLKK